MGLGKQPWEGRGTLVSQASVQTKLFLRGEGLKVSESEGPELNLHVYACAHTSAQGLPPSVGVLGSCSQRGSSGEDVEVTIPRAPQAPSERGLLLGYVFLHSHAITVARTKISET